MVGMTQEACAKELEITSGYFLFFLGWQKRKGILKVSKRNACVGVCTEVCVNQALADDIVVCGRSKV